MANTIMTAKNTFAEGLVMDFAPDNTQATTLTSALNATLLTFNGNEMSLQNDMGNGRVETAYLPDGYVPIGTCEFGDIIYIVSYNPIINKSQIGCFPSPERNISSEEIGGKDQSLKWTDFQGNDGGGPNGELVASSVKKILYDTRDMTSGDKYIIYSGELDSKDNSKYLSDYQNTSHQHGRFPKLVKIHVVSIEESGKITYLDSSTKWYKDNNFYIQNQNKIIEKPDLDSYRTMVSSAYSVFSSKVSGKLALLIELEKITGFSCTWSAYTQEMVDNSDYQVNNYSIYWNFNWATDNFNVNPSAVVLTKSKWTGEDDTHAGQYQTWEYNEKEGGWMLGGANQVWTQGPQVPIPFPNTGYSYSEISRVYSPESYTKSFDQFISSDSYEAKSKLILEDIKNTLGINDVELTKVNLSKTKSGTPDIGKYYFNCQSSAVDDNGNTIYYTSYNNALKSITAQEAEDDIINNTFNYPIVKHFSDFTIPVKQKVIEANGDTEVSEWKNTNINNLIYYYELTPAMPYGLLREFSQDGYIDFKKIGTKSVELNLWRYYNYENTSTLTWGLEAYTEPNKGISEVVFLFYDNQGVAAAYHNSGKISYNGKFTEYFTLNTSGTNHKLNNRGLNGEVFYHKGEPISKDSAIISNTYLDNSGRVVNINSMQEGVTYYLDDAGTLYSNCLYLVKIIVKYCSIGTLDEYIEDESGYIEDYRWYWTNTMFNDYYYSVQDFKGLQFSLNLNCEAVFEADKTKYEVKQERYISSDQYDQSIVSNNAYQSLSATIQYINQDGKQNDNIRMAVRAGLQYDYNTFNIEKTKLAGIDTKIFLANEYISNSPEQPTIKFTQSDTTVYQGVYPTLAKNLTGKVDQTTSDTLNKLVESPITGTGKELWEDINSYENYTTNFHIDSTRYSDKIGNYNSSLVYISSQGEETSTSDFSVYKTTLDLVSYNEDQARIDENKYYPLTLSGVHYSKYYYTNKRNATPANVLRSFVHSSSDLTNYALAVSGSRIQYNKIFLFAIGDKSGANCHITGGISSFNGNSLSSSTPFDLNLGDDRNGSVDEALNYVSDSLLDNFSFLFPVGFGHTWGNSMREAYKNGIKLSSNRYISTGTYSDLDLGGTLAAVLSTGKVEVSDQYGYVDGNMNSLQKFTPIVLGYLTQLFYLDQANTETEVFFYPDNYVYLDTNYTSYKRDIVVELSPNIENHNELLVFNGLIYTKYVDAILDQFRSITHEQLNRTANNINLKLYSCLKTAPIEVHVNYINPSIDSNLDLTQTLVKSIFQDIPPKTSQQFNKDTIYAYNPDANSFVAVRSIYNLRKVKNYFVDGERITASLKNNTSTFYIGQTKDLLGLVNNKLALTSTPSSSGSYSVSTHKKRSITGFKSNLKFYN